MERKQNELGPPLGSDKGKEKVKEEAQPLRHTYNPNIRRNIIKNESKPAQIIVATPSQRPPITSTPKQILTQNRYQPLTQIGTQQTTFVHPTHTENDPDFISKDEILPVIVVEPQWSKILPNNLAEKIFVKNTHFPLINPLKTREFYEHILTDTFSVEVTHVTDQHKIIQFSKFKIMRILSESEWEFPLYKPRSFLNPFNKNQGPDGYTYYDYMDAWYYTLFFRPDSHSWFIHFRKNISLKFPKWFMKWFQEFGPMTRLFPEKILEVYEFFEKRTTFVPAYQLISFVASQGISWILGWNYMYYPWDEAMTITMMYRKIKVKWWKKFDVNIISKEKIEYWVQQNQPVPQQTEAQLIQKAEKEARFLAKKAQLIAEIQNSLSEEEVQERISKINSPVQTYKAKLTLEDEESSTQSNPYLQNRDMMDKVCQLEDL